MPEEFKSILMALFLEAQTFHWAYSRIKRALLILNKRVMELNRKAEKKMMMIQFQNKNKLEERKKLRKSLKKIYSVSKNDMHKKSV